jgi:hypothetical protein
VASSSRGATHIQTLGSRGAGPNARVLRRRAGARRRATAGGGSEAAGLLQRRDTLAVELASAAVELAGATLPLFLFFASLDLDAGDLLRGIPWRPARAQGRRRRAPPHARGPLPPGGRQLPCERASGCTILLEATHFCAWDISSFLLHISGLCRCRPGICWRWSKAPGRQFANDSVVYAMQYTCE